MKSSYSPSSTAMLLLLLKGHSDSKLKVLRLLAFNLASPKRVEGNAEVSKEPLQHIGVQPQ